MTKRRMFIRMVTASLLRRRSRMLIALLSIGIGATILAGMVTIYYDVPRQMRAQMRSYGANMLLMPGDGETLDSDKLARVLTRFPEDALVGAAPYRYVRLDMTSRQQSFTTERVTGTLMLLLVFTGLVVRGILFSLSNWAYIIGFFKSATSKATLE